MDFFQLVDKRESCRNFIEKEVEKEKLEKCINAAILAPSACNGQPWSFIGVIGEDNVLKVRECLQDKGMNKFTEKCPAFIVIAEQPTVMSSKIGGLIKGHDFPQIDIGIATAHICYAATAQGLSTCILGWFDEKKLKKYLDIKSNRRVHIVVAVGYAEDKPLREKKRKSYEDVCIIK